MIGTVPVIKLLLAGIVPVNKLLLARTVPVNKFLLDVTLVYTKLCLVDLSSIDSFNIADAVYVLSIRFTSSHN